MKYVYLDCEFIKEDLTATGLISIGIKSGEHRYYAVNSSMDIRRIRNDPWLMKHVWPHIPSTRRFILDRSHDDVRGYGTIRDQVSDFFERISPSGNAEKDVRVIAWCGAQDLVRLHGMWNQDWSTMPLWIPRYFHDLQEDIVDLEVPETELPQQDTGSLHHSLSDAEHDEVIHQFILEKNPS